MERRRKRSDELARAGDARRAARIAEAQAHAAAEKSKADGAKDRERQKREEKAALAAEQRRKAEEARMEREAQAALDREARMEEKKVRAATKAEREAEAEARRLAEEERRREEEEANLTAEERAALARARELEMQRRLSEAEAQRILQEELARRREWLSEVPIFEAILRDDESTSFLTAVAEKLQVRTAARKDLVIEKGEIGREMFFVVRGEAEVLGNLDDTPFAVLTQGAFFGEMALMEDAPRNAYVRAKTSLKMYVLEQEGLREVFRVFPAMEDAIKNPMEARQKQNEWLSELREWLSEVPIFEAILRDSESTRFLTAVAEKLRVRNAAAKDLVIEKGEIGREMFFVVNGEAEVLGDLDDPPFAELPVVRLLERFSFA